MLPIHLYYLEDARRVLQHVNEATVRAKRVALGQSGTFRIGFTESASWHGVVPDSFRQFRQRQPDAELQLNPLSSALVWRKEIGRAHV